MSVHQRAFLCVLGIPVGLLGMVTLTGAVFALFNDYVWNGPGFYGTTFLFYLLFIPISCLLILCGGGLVYRALKKDPKGNLKIAEL